MITHQIVSFTALEVHFFSMCRIRNAINNLPTASSILNHIIILFASDGWYDYFTIAGVCSCLVVIKITQPLAKRIIRPGQASGHVCCGTERNNGSDGDS